MTVWKRIRAVLPWCLTGALAILVVVAVLLPAAWITPLFSKATDGHVNLVDPDGSLWHGSATLLLAPGSDRSASTLLPGRVEWRTAFWPLFTGRVQMSMRQSTAMPDAITVNATLNGALVSAGSMAVPASLLTGLGTPFNTLDLQGDVRLDWSDWRLLGKNVYGRLTVTMQDVSSRISIVKPLGSYTAVWQAQGAGATLDLGTLKGPLTLQGHGSFAGGSSSFTGTAQADEAHRENLAGLLNLLGRPIGPDTVTLNF